MPEDVIISYRFNKYTLGGQIGMRSGLMEAWVYVMTVTSYSQCDYKSMDAAVVYKTAYSDMFRHVMGTIPNTGVKKLSVKWNDHRRLPSEFPMIVGALTILQNSD